MLLDLLPPAIVLDAACGTGRYSQYLAVGGHRVIGVERSPAQLTRARSCQCQPLGAASAQPADHRVDVG